MNWLMICGFPFMIILWLINPTDSSKFTIYFILTFSSSYFISARVIVSQVIQIIYILISFSVENDVILFLIVLLMSLYTVFKVHWLNRYIYIYRNDEIYFFPLFGYSKSCLSWLYQWKNLCHSYSDLYSHHNWNRRSYFPNIWYITHHFYTNRSRKLFRWFRDPAALKQHLPPVVGQLK